MTDQLRPLEAEAAVVGSILIDPACLPAVEEIIRPEDLALEIHRAIYQAALALRRAGRQIDPVLIRTEAARMGTDLDGAYLLELMDRTPTAANVKEYAKITRTEARRRELGAMLQRAQTAAAKEEPEEVLSTLAREAAELQQEGTTDELIRPEEALLAFYAHRDAVDQGGSRAVVSTGYLDLDSALGGGMVANGLYILAARPGMGKTTLALNIADRVAERVGPVLFVSLEMDVEQLVAKRVSRLSGVASNRVLMRQLSPEEYRKVSAAADKLAKIPVAVNRRAFVTVEQIEALARRVPGLSMVVVDYLGLITPPEWSQKNGRVEATTAISNGLKQTAKALKVPFLVLSQLNRQVESRPDKHPILSDLRDTGAVEQDADAVIFLYRDWYYHPEIRERDPYAPEPLEATVAKNRHGSTGTCELAAHLEVSKILPVSNDPRAAAKKYLEGGRMMDAAELRLNRAAFEQWLQGEGGDNRAELDRLKRALPVVLAECVTETQRQYILHYFVDRMTQKQIGDRYGVDHSTVSRTIHRGLDRMYRYLRFVSPAFIQAPNRCSYLKNR